MLAFVTILQEREFGPMLQAQRHAKNIDFSTIQNASENLEDKLLEPKEGIDLKASNATIPLGILIVFSFVGFYFSGYANIEDTNLKAQIELAPLSLLALRETFSSADTATALFQAAFLASIVAIIMGVYTKIFTLKKGMNDLDLWLENDDYYGHYFNVCLASIFRH